MIHTICKRGETTVLEQRSKRVTKFDESLRTLVADMFETMYAARGVGLAAPQIGIPLQIAVIDCSFGEYPAQRFILVNPKIMKLDGEQTADEGCLSMPGKRIPKRRFETVTIRARDTRGRSFMLTGTGLLARAIQHECDHLNGALLEL